MYQASRGARLDTNLNATAAAAPEGTPVEVPETALSARPLAFELTDLSKVYGRGQRDKWGTDTPDRPIPAVDHPSLSAPAGQVLGLLGPNGAGKTTIKMLGGLVTPTSGRVRLDGYAVSHQQPLAVRQVGAALEGSRNVYWSLSARQNLVYLGQLKGLRATETKPRAERLLTEVRLWDGGTRPPARSPAACSKRSRSPPR